jgi:hypothetical protein
MKKLVLFMVTLLLCSLTTNAQTFKTLRDSIDQVRASKMKMIHPGNVKGKQQDKRLGLVYLMDSSLRYRWDGLNNTWGNQAYTRTKYTYDSDGRTASYKYYWWRSITNQWVDRYEISYVYNANGNLTDWIYNEYDTITNAWVPNEHDILVYNFANRLISETWNYYNKVNDSWFIGELWKYDETGGLIEHYYKSWDYYNYIIENGYRYTYDLNDMDMPTETVGQDWDTISDNWINTSQVISEYTNDTILDLETINEWAGSYWALNGQNTYSYTNDLLTGINYQYWDEGSMTWLNSGRDYYSYNANSLLAEYLYQYWDGASWVNYYKYLYSYDENGNRTSLVNMRWYNDTWTKYSERTYTYNANGDETDYTYISYDYTTGLINYGYNYTYSYDFNNLNTRYIYRYWDTDINAWRNSSLTNYYYSLHNSSGLNEPGADFANVYPNPASNELHVSNLHPNYIISVCDVAGNILISKKALSSIEKIDISNLSRGIYLLKIFDNKLIRTKKFVKQ